MTAPVVCALLTRSKPHRHGSSVRYHALTEKL
jgi:uncharacterized protein YwbE